MNALICSRVNIRKSINILSFTEDTRRKQVLKPHGDNDPINESKNEFALFVNFGSGKEKTETRRNDRLVATTGIEPVTSAL